VRDPLTDLATVPPIPIHPAVVAARLRLAQVVDDLRAVPDASLDTMWRWRSTDTEDVELRYGLYRIGERIEEAISAIEVGRAEGSGAAMGPAVPALGVMAAARWELHGILTTLPSRLWDSAPSEGEWSVRMTMAHIIVTQRLYGWSNAWFLRHPATTGDAAYPPDGILPPEPSEEEEGAGTPDEVRARFDSVVDASIAAHAGLGSAAMEAGARWANLPVTLDFRLGRSGSHIREHTIQIDKTLATLGHVSTEVDRVIRMILAAYGRLEALIVGRRPDILAQRFASGADATSIVTIAMADLVETADRVRAGVAARA
jgi:hypothetical protein